MLNLISRFCFYINIIDREANIVKQIININYKKVKPIIIKVYINSYIKKFFI